MKAPSDAELRALLRRDLQAAPGAGTASALKKAAAPVAAVGLLVSLGLLYASFWFQMNMDAIISIPFVLGSLMGAVMLGMPCAYYLATGKITAPPMPF